MENAVARANGDRYRSGVNFGVEIIETVQSIAGDFC